MDTSDVKEFVKHLIHTIWEKQETDRLDRFYHKDVKGFYNDDEVDFKGLEEKVEIFHKHMKHLKIKINHLLVEKEKYALHAHQCFEIEGKKVEVASMLFVHLKDGKIHRYWLKTRMPLDFNHIP